MPTFRIIVTQNDGRQGRVLHDHIINCADLGAAKVIGNNLIQPYEGGRSHVPGVTAAIYGQESLCMARRGVNEPWMTPVRPTPLKP